MGMGAASYSRLQAFDDSCDQAGCPSSTPRTALCKAAAALMHEKGTSAAELCAIFGCKLGCRMAAYYAKK